MFATLFMKSGNGKNIYIDEDKSVADHLNSHHHTCDRTPYVWGGSSPAPVILQTAVFIIPLMNPYGGNVFGSFLTRIPVGFAYSCRVHQGTLGSLSGVAPFEVGTPRKDSLRVTLGLCDKSDIISLAFDETVSNTVYHSRWSDTACRLVG